MGSGLGMPLYRTNPATLAATICLTELDRLPRRSIRTLAAARLVAGLAELAAGLGGPDTPASAKAIRRGSNRLHHVIVGVQAELTVNHPRAPCLAWARSRQRPCRARHRAQRTL
jgi:hypothetical protein